MSGFAPPQNEGATPAKSDPNENSKTEHIENCNHPTLKFKPALCACRRVTAICFPVFGRSPPGTALRSGRSALRSRAARFPSFICRGNRRSSRSKAGSSNVRGEPRELRRP